MYATILWTSQRYPKIYKPQVAYRFYCMALLRSAMAGRLYKHHSKHTSNSGFD